MIARILILSLSLWLSGCTIAGKSPPSRFYILPGPEAARPMSRIKLVIAIAPVRLPKYLHRPQIVTVRRDGVIELAEFHRWAEPLTAGFTRVLRAGLANRLPQSHVVILPAPRSRPDWLIETRVHEFQVHPKHCILQADWRLIRGTRIHAWERVEIRQPLPGRDYATIAKIMGIAIDRLAAGMAATIAGLN